MKILKSLTGVWLTVVGLAVVLGASPAEACTEMFCIRYPWLCDQVKPLLKVEISPLPGRGAEIEISGWYLVPMEAQIECVVVVPRVPEIEGIRGVRVRHANGSTVYAFSPSTAPQLDFADLARARWPESPAASGWFGFVAHVPAGGVQAAPASMVFRVTLPKGVSLEDLAVALQRHGILGSGSARPDGRLDFHHWDLNRFGDMEVSIKYRLPPLAEAARPGESN